VLLIHLTTRVLVLVASAGATAASTLELATLRTHIRPENTGTTAVSPRHVS